MIRTAGQDSCGFALCDTPGAGGICRFSHAAMATVFEIYCVHADEKYARQAARTAFDVVDRLEQELSRFVENSDISRINSLAAGQSVQVGLWTMECLQIACLAYSETGGAFDISIGSGLEGLELDPDGCMVHAQADGIGLDLGGIGKGYAVDRMAELLEDWGVTRALIHGGYSSVLALEPPPGRSGWPLTLSMPGAARGALLARISTRRQALSGSGIQKGDHIVDPRKGQPVRHRPAAWVSGSLDALAAFCRRPKASNDAVAGTGSELNASPAAVADALSTAFMILTREEIENCCRNHPGLETWFLADAQQAEALVHFPN